MVRVNAGDASTLLLNPILAEPCVNPHDLVGQLVDRDDIGFLVAVAV